MAIIQEIKDNQAALTTSIDTGISKIQAALANIPSQVDLDGINQTILEQKNKIDTAVANL